MKLIRLLIILLLIPVYLYSQKTIENTDPVIKYNIGLELYRKGMYSSSEKVFMDVYKDEGEL
jgi:hypothetical protein